MSDDIKHFREAVAKFDELKLELEDLKEGLESNFENYKNVSDISSDIADKNQSVLENINSLQINAISAVESAFDKVTDLKEKMSKYYSAEYSQTKKNLDALLSSMENELSTLKSTIKTTIEDAVRSVNIDTSDLAKVIDQKIAKFDLSKLDNAIKQMALTMTKIEQIDSILQDSVKLLDQTANKISTKTEEINDAVENINSANKSLSMAMTLAMLFVGIVIGAGIMTYFKIDATSNFYFSQYEQKQVKLKADQEEIKARLDTLSAFEKWIVSNNYKFNFGKFDDSNQNYISIDKNTHSKCKGWQGYSHDVLQDHAYIATSKNLVVCFD